MPYVFTSNAILDAPSNGVIDPSLVILDSKFAGLNSIILAQSYSNGREYRFDGTDSVTGQLFSTTSPQAYGAQTGEPRLQALTNVSHGEPGIDPDTNWTLTQLTGITGPDGGSTALEITRNSPYLDADQGAYRIKPDTTWDQQGMLYIRGKVKLSSSWPATTDQFFGLAEVKQDGTNQKLELYLTRESSKWRIRMYAGRLDGGGATSIWGSGGTSSVTCAPTEDEFFNDGAGQDIFFSYGAMVPDVAGPAPNFGRWWTFEFAFRLEDALGQVQGNGAQGWCWAATAEGTSSAAAANGSGTQRFYIEGRNKHGTFAASAPSGATIIFPFLHYCNADVTSLPYQIGHIEVYRGWPSDASTHPVGAV